MADDIRTLRRNKKVAGIDDPVIIVQRILNIFRQLHILDDKQKEDFNNMILRQPPEIRHMCSVLPGGSLLQEYIDELEEIRGIAPDQKLDDDGTNTAPKETILAAALNEAPAKAPQPQETASASAAPSPAPTSGSGISNEDFQKQMLLMMQAMKSSTAPAPAVSGTITADANFAKEIATALADALAASDEKRRQETQELTKSLTNSQLQMTKILVSQMLKNGGKSNDNAEPNIQVQSVSNGSTTETVKVIDNTQEITKAITDSQLQMAKMFLQQNAINAAASSNSNNANTIQINNAPIVQNHQELIGDIVKAQSQLFREMTKEQTKELAVLIADAIKESSKLSNKSMIEALSSFQKENLKFLEKQAKNQNQKVVYYQAPIPGATAAAPMAPAAETIYEPEVQPHSDNTPSYIKKVLGNVFSRNKNEETEEFAYSAQPETEIVDETIPAEKNPDLTKETTPAAEAVFYDAPAQETEAGNPLFAEEEEFIGNTDDDSDDESSLSVLTAENDVKKKKKKKKKNKNKANAAADDNSENTGYAPIYAGAKTVETAFDNNPGDENSNDDFNLDDLSFDNLSEAPVSESENGFGLDNSLFDLDIPEPDFDKGNPKDTAIESTAEELPATDDLPKLDFSILEDDTAEETVDPKAYYSPVTGDIETEITTGEDEAAQIPDISEAYGTADAEIIEEEPSEEEPISSDTPEADFSDTGFENEDPADAVQEAVQPAAADTEPVIASKSETIKKSPSILLQNLKNLSGLSTMFGAESENKDDEPLDLDADYKIDFQNPEDDNDLSADSEQDWEWEHEDEESSDTSQNNNEVLTTAPETGNEDGEWEWEYEEVADDNTPEEEMTASANQETPLEAETEDGEWEWEYEEVADDNTPVEEMTFSENQETPLEAEAEDGEWEWEYEEVADDNTPEEETTFSENQETPLEAEAEDSEWEWEYEEVADDNIPEEETTFSANQKTPLAAEAEEGNREDETVEEDNNGSTGDISAEDDISAKLKTMDDGDLNALFDKFEQSDIMIDPYQGAADDNGNDLELTSLQSGSLYFQEDVTAPAENKMSLTPNLSDLEPEIVFSELGEEENPNEPYKLNSDLKP